MNMTFSLEPNSIKKQQRVAVSSKEYQEYTMAYVGKDTYCWNTKIDNGIQYEVQNDRIIYNLQIGNYNSIGNNLNLIFGRNHNIKSISTGALQLMLQQKNICPKSGTTTFNQKGSIIIQNDVWIGENVTIMAGVTIGNGAVIARNSHVVKNVPPFAVAGGNPAKVIGYRYSEEQIEKLQKIQWWYWDEEKIIANADYFNEDVDRFCDTFFPYVESDFLPEQKTTTTLKDTYFAFVDYYENYCSYPFILESFLDRYIQNKEKELVLFVRNDCDVEPIKQEVLENLYILNNEISSDKNIQCSVKLMIGDCEEAERIFRKCMYYITNRVFDTVYFACLADLLGIEVISGVDSLIQFDKTKNFLAE